MTRPPPAETFRAMKFDLDGLDETELRELHRRIVERLRWIRRSEDQVSMRQFALGERVASGNVMDEWIQERAGASFCTFVLVKQLL